MIDIDHDLDLTPAERVSRILNRGYLLGWHYLPHDAIANQKSGRTFQMELGALGLKNTRVVPRTLDVWVGINHLRGILPRFSFRVPECERGLDMLSAYHTKRETAGGTALDIPVHDASSHYADALRVLGEADMAGMLHSAGAGGLGTSGRGVTVRTGFRGGDEEEPLRLLARVLQRGASGSRGALGAGASMKLSLGLPAGYPQRLGCGNVCGSGATGNMRTRTRSTGGRGAWRE